MNWHANTTFHGIYPILYAFFDRTGALDRAAIATQIEACVRGGAHGVAILGLATEVNKLSLVERRQFLDWSAEALDGRLPLAVTIAEPSVTGQIEFAHAARACGAAWLILQPPAIVGAGDAEYLEFFSRVAEKIDLPFGLQNAPGLLGASLGNATLRELNRRYAHFCLLKGEGPATYIERLVADTNGCLDVFNGYGGLQLPNSLRAGCAGLIPAIDIFDPQVRIYELMRSGNPAAEAEAEALYRELLPLIVFLMSSIENFIQYGKRLTAQRLGLGNVVSRLPALPVTDFGLACLRRYSAMLPPLLAT
jgi:4-hydroxy-tetrahydrodipicolinate synthase